jgi:hypothetical protein
VVDVPRLDWGTELRHFQSVVGNYAEADLRIHRQLGDAIRLRFPVATINLVHPAHNVHVLKDIANFPKSEDYETLHPVLGQGIFVTEGDVWAK